MSKCSQCLKKTLEPRGLFCSVHQMYVSKSQKGCNDFEALNTQVFEPIPDIEEGETYLCEVLERGRKMHYPAIVYKGRLIYKRRDITPDVSDFRTMRKARI